MSEIKFTRRILDIAEMVQAALGERFGEIDEIAEANTKRVLEAFRAARVSDACFAGTTGYGYNDLGREALDRVFAEVFGGHSALVRLGFVSGTHAIASALFAALKPGDTLLSVTGAPYDTLRGVIGISGNNHGSLKFYGIGYAQIDLSPFGDPDYEEIRAKSPTANAVFIQRSRGYSARRALSIADIERIIGTVREANPDAAIIVDNCYGEFVEAREPTHVGANLIAGSLIKNPGGGLAPSGGYVAGDAELVENAAQMLTAPGLGSHVGATLGQNRLLLQGLFTAPHTVAQALKTAVFCAGMLEHLGYKTSPSSMDPRSDIIQAIELGSPEALLKFCGGIQHASPVDSFATPEPWAMPGYDDPVVMAAGAFVQGASIELSADAPLREPYRAYLQGGLTYESAKLGIMLAVSEMLGESVE